ncbi:hypothetical protein H0H93_006126 [Arthromyces matolae]|nr:hypothetical protein H0H93_006126 [Arthromyces matolae]
MLRTTVKQYFTLHFVTTLPSRNLRCLHQTASSWDIHQPHDVSGMPPPLKGIRILDLTRVLAGPTATMLLADLGADVIKVEEVSRGDDTRSWNPPSAPIIENSPAESSHLPPESAYFLAVNRNKRSMTVNFKTPEGLEIVHKLIKRSDVLVENFVSGKLDTMGLGYEDCYGQTGPYRQAAGYDVIVEAEAGLMHITGEPDRPPSKVGVAATDVATGLYAHGAIMAALLSRQQTGKGGFPKIAGLANIASNYLIADREASRHGTAHPSIVPYQVFPCKDGFLMIGAGNNKQFKLLAEKILDNPALATDPRFATNEARVANRAELIDIISNTLLKRERAHWITLFTGLGVPFGPINNIKQTFDHPQAIARQVTVEVEHPRAGKIKLVAPPVSYNGKKMAVRMPPPWLSQHTTECSARCPAMPLTIDLPTPEAFSAFPFQPPYEIQVELMRHLYSSIEDRKVTIVESPTGTGKTLSLLCASLTWLKDEKDRASKGKLRALVADGDDAKDWVVEQTRARVQRELEADEREYEARLLKAKKREDLLKKMSRARVVKKMKRETQPTKPTEEENDDQFLPEDNTHGDGEEEMNISPALRALMDKVENPRRGQGDDTEITCTKIYYASRTHSQLVQVIPELQRLKLYPRATINHHPGPTSKKRSAEDAENDDGDAPTTRTVALGSRRQLCVNDELRHKSRDLDESCRELLGEKPDKRCQYLPSVDEEEKMLDFRDQILAAPKDIEDLAEAGRRAEICPYFGARRAIPQAQKSAREALGIDLTDQIVIIDEAHNLIPTLLSLSTTRLPQSTLMTSFMQVCTYVSKFRNRLGPANLLHLKRLVVFLDALKKYVLEWRESRMNKSMSDTRHGETVTQEKTEVMTPAQLVERLGRKASGINLLEIEKYLRTSKVARKIAGYSDKEAEKSGGKVLYYNVGKGCSHRQPDIVRSRRGEIPPLNVVEAFLLSLTGETDGRPFCLLVGNPGTESVELKFQLLNPSPPFKEVVDVARSVVLAGGTMSPDNDLTRTEKISDLVDQLFSYIPSSKLSSFSCGHIIPAQNLQTLVVSKSPRGQDLEFKAGKQSDENVTFFEPVETTGVDQVLQDYSAAVRESPAASSSRAGGALLLAVIGAKLSEGLNFADDLARAVVVVGLPFANLGSPELKERMKYVKRLEEIKAPKAPSGKKDAAAELYENMCMNAVNQSIGRAIRHRGDWASLILLDRRYASNSIRNKLPKWIGKDITVTDGFGQAMKSLNTFYRDKK